MDRTNMVSLIDAGTLGGGPIKLMQMNDGISELTENWDPQVKDKHYINQKNASSSITGYKLSMSPQVDFLDGEFQGFITTMSKTFPTGTECETFYYRFYKSDIKGNTGECVRVPVTVAFSSVGGSGGDDLVSSININGNGSPELGTITISEDGFTWAAK